MNILDFANDEYINLITYRKDGTQVPTPVWLASLDNSLVITTSLNAGKVKRVRANGKATIYKTNQSGSKKLSEEIDVKASIIEDENEKQAVLPFIIATPLLFALGAAMVYYLVIPLAWSFFLSFEVTGTEGTLPIEVEPRISEYLSLVMSRILIKISLKITYLSKQIIIFH